MAQPTNLRDLIGLCKVPNKRDRLKTVSKDVIADILLGCNADEEPKENDDMKTMMKALMNDMQELRQSNETIVKGLSRMERLESEMMSMKKENEKLHAMIMNQQNFLESIDARDRQRNAVFLGVPEQADELGESDVDKIGFVIETIGSSSNIAETEMKRLGKPGMGNKRPILVVFPSKIARNEVLDKANQLKSNNGEHADILKKIYIKKDVHPVVRKERDRLRKVVKNERDRPENENVEIVYDMKKGIVTRDGVVIDRFMPIF